MTVKEALKILNRDLRWTGVAFTDEGVAAEVLKAVAATSHAEGVAQGWREGAGEMQRLAVAKCVATVTQLETMAEALKPYAPGSQVHRQARRALDKADTVRATAALIFALPLPPFPGATGGEDVKP